MPSIIYGKFLPLETFATLPYHDPSVSLRNRPINEDREI